MDKRGKAGKRGDGATKSGNDGVAGATDRYDSAVDLDALFSLSAAEAASADAERPDALPKVGMERAKTSMEILNGGLDKAKLLKELDDNSEALAEWLSIVNDEPGMPAMLAIRGDEPGKLLVELALAPGHNPGPSPRPRAWLSYALSNQSPDHALHAKENLLEMRGLLAGRSFVFVEDAGDVQALLMPFETAGFIAKGPVPWMNPLSIFNLMMGKLHAQGDVPDDLIAKTQNAIDVVLSMAAHDDPSFDESNPMERLARLAAHCKASELAKPKRSLARTQLWPTTTSPKEPPMDGARARGSLQVFPASTIAKLKAANRLKDPKISDICLRDGERDVIPAVEPGKILALKEAYPHFHEAIDEIAGRMAMCRARSDKLGRPIGAKFGNILLVGEPGLGKTSFVNALEEAMGLPAVKLGMASASASFILVGSDAGWADAKTGAVFKELCNGTAANFIMLLDEIDKAAQDGRFNALGPLYPLLEQRSAKEMVDEYVGGPMDASHINFIATANSVERIEPALLDRFTVIHVQKPTGKHALAAFRSIYRSVMIENGWDDLMDAEPPEEVAELMVGMGSRRIRAALSKAIPSAFLAGRSAPTPEDLLGSIKVEKIDQIVKDCLSARKPPKPSGDPQPGIGDWA